MCLLDLFISGHVWVSFQKCISLFQGVSSQLNLGCGVVGLPCGSSVDSACNAGDTGDSGSILGSGRSPGGGHSNPLHYSCLGNPTDRGAWWAIIQGVAKSRTRRSHWAHSTHALGVGMLLLSVLVGELVKTQVEFTEDKGFAHKWDLVCTLLGEQKLGWSHCQRGATSLIRTLICAGLKVN